MRRTLSKFVLMTALVVGGCNNRHENRAAEAFGIAASSNQSRCASLPLDQASDPACKREGDENFRKFMGKGVGS